MLNKPVSRRAQPSVGIPRLSGVNDNQRLRLVTPTGQGLPGRAIKLNQALGVVGLALTALYWFQNKKPDSWDNLGAWVQYCETLTY